MELLSQHANYARLDRIYLEKECLQDELKISMTRSG